MPRLARDDLPQTPFVLENKRNTPNHSVWRIRRLPILAAQIAIAPFKDAASFRLPHP